MRWMGGFSRFVVGPLVLPSGMRRLGAESTSLTAEDFSFPRLRLRAECSAHAAMPKEQPTIARMRTYVTGFSRPRSNPHLKPAMTQWPRSLHIGIAALPRDCSRDFTQCPNVIGYRWDPPRGMRA